MFKSFNNTLVLRLLYFKTLPNLIFSHYDSLNKRTIEYLRGFGDIEMSI